ncbi:peptidase T [Carnobacterium sp. 17-4]|uniref:peptidase T n=1 Tax=Carnobacterium sp. (strain 17-4) TaxID=208596 RepID=UPI000310A549|nr:peptidase T [Carnobacterium sp. 17-4]
MNERLLERFVKYAKVNTRSDMNSQTVPTTYSQVEFALKLAEELQEIGLEEVEFNEKNGFVTATLSSNLPHEVPTIGFIAHIDTADFNAENIQPQVHTNYDGQDILLNEKLGIVMSTTEFPQLANYVGKTVITTDGTTLLGADDKAGMASIVTALEEFIQHPELPHGKIRVAFGPDEEIGRGALLFDVAHFQADFAYTLDSGVVGKFEYETFNAAQAELTIKGTSVHPGTAKDSMVNALLVAAQFATALPQEEVPEKTEGYQGFYMLSSQVGTIDEVKATYIIRDHDKITFEKRKQHFISLVDQFNEKFDQPRIDLKLYDQYYNMRDIIENDLSIVELALDAYKSLGIEPDVKAFRGGTDGSIITYKGLPTPNIFTGAENLHGKYEFVSLEGMEQAAQVVIEIARMNAEK